MNVLANPLASGGWKGARRTFASAASRDSKIKQIGKYWPNGVSLSRHISHKHREVGKGDQDNTYVYCCIAAKGWIEEYTKYTNTQYIKIGHEVNRIE